MPRPAPHPGALDRPAHQLGAVILPELRPGRPLPPPDLLASHPPAGVIAFGRSREDGARLAGLPALIRELRHTCESRGIATPFVCCDLEQGAGLHFEAGTVLPPALALAAADNGARAQCKSIDWVASAAALTGLEARGLGIDLVLAPVLDVNTRADNPIIAVRSFGDDVAAVSARAASFLRGLSLAGAGACPKHFPGHGDTQMDSHLVLPRIDRTEAELWDVELRPYRGLLQTIPSDPDCEPDAVMVGHLDVPALAGEEGIPATLSRRICQGLLRDRLGFRGAALTDGLMMGALGGEPSIFARSLEAGCDGLLYPEDHASTVEELETDLRTGRLSPRTLRIAADRMHDLRERLHRRAPAQPPRFELARIHPLVRPGLTAPDAAAFSRELAAACLCRLRPHWPWEPGRSYTLELLPAATGDVVGSKSDLESLLKTAAPGTGAPLVLAVDCRVRPWRGRAGLDSGEEAALLERIARARAAGSLVGVVWFGSPQLLPLALLDSPDVGVLVAFAANAPMVEAARSFLRGEVEAGGALPTRLPSAVR